MTASGFFTAEIREAGERVGFTINTLDGCSGVLSHIRFGGGARVGRYGVDVKGFEDLVLRASRRARQGSASSTRSERWSAFASLLRGGLSILTLASREVASSPR